MQTSYINEAATKNKVKMLLATAFLPPHDVPVAVELLGRDATGSIAALFNYFRVEWMLPDRLPMWNVYNVNIRTNNDLEGWHFKMNRLAGKRHLGFYELLQLLIDEQGSTETLFQQVTTIKNKKYEELQQRIAALTAEYNGGTRTLEQFLRAVAYHY
ncbi:reverse transcriptase family protein [Trichinella spiralis]|uniref:reverse transcriptase family protein n=1 Tax=Trichinella spiralis TaxID=6334 RepID=UPI0001EFDE19|nr:reverse transcriptase family protein [Trichinella spiralis]